MMNKTTWNNLPFFFFFFLDFFFFGGGVWGGGGCGVDVENPSAPSPFPLTFLPPPRSLPL